GEPRGSFIEHFLECEAVGPEEGNAALQLRHLPTEIAARDEVTAIEEKALVLRDEADVVPLDLDEPPVVMEADFRNPTKSGAEREEPRLTEYLALPRRRFDVAGLRDADQLGTDGQRVADIFEQVRAEC